MHLVPDVEVIKHDHSYSLDPCLHENNTAVSSTSATSSDGSIEYTASILDDSTIATFKGNMRVSSAVRHHIEESTRKQSSSSNWYSVQAQRITSSSLDSEEEVNSTFEALLVS